MAPPPGEPAAGENVSLVAPEKAAPGPPPGAVALGGTGGAPDPMPAMPLPADGWGVAVVIAVESRIAQHNKTVKRPPDKRQTGKRHRENTSACKRATQREKDRVYGPNVETLRTSRLPSRPLRARARYRAHKFSQ